MLICEGVTLRALTWALIVAGAVGVPRCSSAGERTDELAMPAAEQHMADGETAMAQADYPTAIAHFKVAVELAPTKPGPHLMLGLAYAASNDCAAAVPELEMYFNLKKSDHRPTAARALDDCLARLKPPPGSSSGSTSAPPTSSQTTETTPSRPALPAAVLATPPLAARAVESRAATLHPRRRVATWVVGGVGLGLLAGSLAAGLLANADYNRLSSSCAPDGSCSLAVLPDAHNLIDSGRAAGTASDVLLGIGGAAVVTSVVLFFVEGRHRGAQHASTRQSITDGPRSDPVLR